MRAACAPRAHGRRRHTALPMVAPPHQRQREHQSAAMHQCQRGARCATLAARHPGLRQVDQVVVDDEGEQREQQVPVGWRGAGSVAASPIASSTRFTAPNSSPRRQTSSPWLRAVGSRTRSTVRSVLGERADALLHLLLADQHLIAREAAPACARRDCAFELVALPAVEHQKPVGRRCSPGARCAPRSAHSSTLAVGAARTRRARSSPRRDRRSMKNTRRPSREVWNDPGVTRDRSERCS